MGKLTSVLLLLFVHKTNQLEEVIEENNIT